LAARMACRPPDLLSPHYSQPEERKLRAEDLVSASSALCLAVR
jgi:hypothetical protein